MRSGRLRRQLRRPLRPALAAPVVALAVLAAGACGGSGDGGSGDGGAAPADGPTSTTTAGGGVDDVPAVPSEACRTPRAEAVRDDPRTVTVAGTERSYLLTIPESATGRDPVPLVLDVHGLDGAETQARLSAFGDLAEREGFVVAHPQGLGSPAAWNTNISNTNIDLVAIDAILDQIGRDVCVDTGRTYAVGFSTGAEFVTTLACLRSQRIAAVGAVAGVDHKNRCAPSRGVPLIAVHGTADTVLRFNGGVGDVLRVLIGGEAPPGVTVPAVDLNGEGVPLNMSQWATANGCTPTPTDTDVSPEVIRRTFDCPEGAEVELLVVKGGGHTWPGSAESQRLAAVLGTTSGELDATAALWEFLRRQHLPQD